MPADLNLGIPDAGGSGVPVQCGDCGSHFMLDPSGDVAGAACASCGGSRFFRSQPSATQSDGTLRNMVDSDSQHDQGGNPLGEGTIMGVDGERPGGKRDNYMHGKVAYPTETPMMYEPMPGGLQEDQSLNQWRQAPERHVCPICGEDFSNNKLGFSQHLMEAHPGFGMNNGEVTYAKRVERMKTSNMEPYPPLWDESYTKTAGPLALLPEALSLGGEAAGAGEAAAGAGEAADAGGGGLLGGAKGLLGKGIGHLMKGVFGGGDQAGSMAPTIPTPAPVVSSTDIPFLLVADLETPHSVKSVGEQNDNPEHQDQKEFNVGDKDPSNLLNPNNEDSGANGEDGVKDATPGFGLGEHSPSIERAEMILPLLLHYFQSEESGQNDPLIRALHEALEQESPGYMDQENPEGEQAVTMLLQHGKPQHQAGVNMMGQPGPGGGMAQGGGGMCPNCGGVLTADGSCPQCGHKSGTQWGAQAPTGSGAPLSGGMAPGGPSLPPNRVGTSQAGPQTPEQKAAVIQLLEHQGRHAEIPQVELEPWRFAAELAQISQQPNVAPLVDPNQAPPQAPPPQGMMDPSGGMPVNDPSQGGGGMPMQPMSHVLGSYGWGQPQDPWHQFAYEKGVTQPDAAQKWFDWAKTMQGSPHTPPGQPGSLWSAPQGPDAFHQQQMGQIQAPGGDQPPMQPMASFKQADANNAVPRCPKCGSATTSIHGVGDNTTDGNANYFARCHACDHVWQEKQSRVILTDLMNPALQDVTEQMGHHDNNTLTWKDAQGQPLQVGQTYEMHTAGVSIPDEVKVVASKPDEIGLALVGDIAGVRANHGDTPDFSIHASNAEKYTFVPTGMPNGEPVNDGQPKGGMPGMEQIPQTPQTTDEATNSYPNRGTVSQVLASDEIDDSNELCHGCGGDWIDHVASSPTTTMHECARCGSIWETKDEFEGREANVNLDWLNDGNSTDFAGEMERFREARGPGRNLQEIAANNNHYQSVKQVLSQNKMSREAGRHFTPGEQRALINERGKARNLDQLSIGDTHYAISHLPPNAREDLVPDEHLVLGL